eukprot:670372_1
MPRRIWLCHDHISIMLCALLALVLVFLTAFDVVYIYKLHVDVVGMPEVIYDKYYAAYAETKKRYNSSIMRMVMDNVTIDYNNSICIFIPSFHRPINLYSSLPYYNALDIVSQIVVGHGDEMYYDDTIKSHKINHVKDWDVNKKWFTVRRFITPVKYCVSDHILIIDDDLLVSNKYISKLFNRYRNDTDNFYGYYPRICSKEGYIFKGAWNGSHNVVLSTCMITSRNVIKNVAHQFENTTFSQKVLENKGNGEDLLWNYYYVKLYGKRPGFVAADNKHKDLKNLQKKPGFSTSNRRSHMKIRSAMCRNFFNNTPLLAI